MVVGLLLPPSVHILLHVQHALLVAPLADVVAAAIDAEVRVLQSADALRHL